MKLKEIPANIVVHTPTETEAEELLAILHENGYRWVNHSKYSLLDMDWWNTDDMCYIIKPQAQVVGWNTRFSLTVHSLEKPTFITLAEFKRLYCEEEKPQPKFKVGDKVIVKEDWAINTPLKVEKYDEADNMYKLEGLPIIWLNESQLEHYTEPETKTTEEVEENHELSQNSAEKCDNDDTISTDENKELNLCELLKGLEGQSFYSPCYGDVDLIEVHSDKIVILAVANDKKHTLGKRGKHYAGFAECMCMLFPSRTLYEQYPLDPVAAWTEWQEEQTIFHIRIEFQPYEERGEMKCGNMGTLHFDDLKLRTPADRDKCLSEIQAIIEKYSKK